MFTEMINFLREGKLPAKPELGRRLQLAVVKKMGILQAPYLCRSSDPKINPPAAHLLWAAVLIGDAEKVRLAADLAWTEELERRPGRRNGRQAYLADVLVGLAGVVAGTAVADPVRRLIFEAAGWLGLDESAGSA